MNLEFKIEALLLEEDSVIVNDKKAV